MWHKAKNIRTFIGARRYDETRTFYRELGFEEVVLSEKLSLFKVNAHLAFYLQKYYVRKWVHNSMLFIEVADIESCDKVVLAKGLHEKYKYVRFTKIKTYEWGRELFMDDPSGVLWHFCQFNSND